MRKEAPPWFGKVDNCSNACTFIDDCWNCCHSKEKQLIDSIKGFVTDSIDYKNKIIKLCGCGCIEKSLYFKHAKKLVKEYGWNITLQRQKTTIKRWEEKL